jgi:hypothetical protein
MTAAENSYILANGGYSARTFVGVEDLPNRSTDDWNDLVYAFKDVTPANVPNRRASFYSAVLRRGSVLSGGGASQCPFLRTRLSSVLAERRPSRASAWWAKYAHRQPAARLCSSGQMTPSSRSRCTSAIDTGELAQQRVGVLAEQWRASGRSSSVTVRRQLTRGGADRVEPCAMRIDPGHRITVHGQQEATPRPLPPGTPSNVRKYLRHFVRDPEIAEQGD